MTTLSDVVSPGVMKRNTLFIDLETFSSEDLAKAGVFRYVEATDFEILLMSYAFGDEPVRVWDFVQNGPPPWLAEALTDPEIVKAAHNYQFERACLNKALGVYTPPEQWVDTMHLAAMNGLPMTLEAAGAALQLDQQKLDTGKALIRYFCKPCAATKTNGGRTRNRPEHAPEKWAQFKEYCLRDTETERAIYHITGKDKILDGVEITAKAHSFHPVREYIQAAEWDGVPRVDTLLVRYLGAADTAYTRAVTRKTLVAAVARVFRPGVKFDYMLTIRGRQGIGKTALIGRLAGDWYSDSFSTVQGKEAYEQVRRAWIIEVGELAGMKKAEAEAIKLFISKREDQYRPAYGRQIEIFPRQCIFVGTTNEAEFLRDPTGNRRFWVVDTPNSDSRVNFRPELTEDVVHQIWAEAYHYYQQGEDLYLTGEAEAEANRIQEEFAEADDRAGMVQGYLDRLLPEDWPKMDIYARREWLGTDAKGTVKRTRVCRMEIWCEVFGNPPGRIDRYESKAIHAILEKAGWRMGGSMRLGGYGKQRIYRPAL